MEPCPDCHCTAIGLDYDYTHGVAHFCQQCGARPNRVAIHPGTLHADMEALADSAWNEWAEASTPMQGDELRFSS